MNSSAIAFSYLTAPKTPRVTNERWQENQAVVCTEGTGKPWK